MYKHIFLGSRLNVLAKCLITFDLIFSESPKESHKWPIKTLEPIVKDVESFDWNPVIVL